MATPLTDAINALTAYANGITGKSDTNLPDAVRSLADGYGQGGTEYEEGTCIPETSANPTISFANAHSKAPDIVIFIDAESEYTIVASSGTLFWYLNVESVFGVAYNRDATSKWSTMYGYARVTGNLSQTLGFGNMSSPSNYVNNTRFIPFFGNVNYKCTAGRTYKWKAIWM